MEPQMVRRAAFGHQDPQSAHDAAHGFPVGTHILTDTGPVAVETLTAGDLVLTRNGGAQPILSVDTVTRRARAIKFSEACFGRTGPICDMLLPEEQPVLIRDWRARALFGQSQAMVCAGQLVDDTFIHDIGPRRFLLFRLDLGRARVVQGFGIDLGTAAQASSPVRAVA